MNHPYEGAGTFTVGPDASNPRDRRISAPGCRHVAKVYGQTEDEAAARAAWIAKALNTMAALDHLTASEGGAVTVLAPNADFVGPGAAIEVVADWTNWQTVRYEADTPLAALQLAVSNPMAGRIVGEGSATDVPDATRAMTARVVAERVRQQTEEGRTPDWDDRHTTGGLAQAAACYALNAADTHRNERAVAECWPWDWSAWKPGETPMRDLERAGALILAEMERRART